MEAGAALSRPGRYKEVAGNLKVKEVRIGEDERFVVCSNPEAAERDAQVRTRLLAHLTELIKDSDRLPPMKRAELKGVISTKPGLSVSFERPPVVFCASIKKPSAPTRSWTASISFAQATPRSPRRTSPWDISNSPRWSGAGGT